MPSAIYHNDASLDYDKARMLKAKSELTKISEFDYYPEYHPRYHYLASLISILDKKGISVLDIGGGAGYGYSYVKWSCPERDVQFDIWDLPDICKLGNEIFSDVNEVRYLDNFEDKTYDVVFFGASVQYFDDPLSLLKKIIMSKPMYIAIVQSPLSEVESFYSAQVNLSNRMIPSFILNREQLYATLSSEGYALKLKTADTVLLEKFNNFPDGYGLTKYWSHVFQRKI